MYRNANCVIPVAQHQRAARCQNIGLRFSLGHTRVIDREQGVALPHIAFSQFKTENRLFEF